MQVAAGDTDVAAACGVSHLGKGPSACQRVAYKHVPAVVDGERLESSGTEHLACGAEALAERVAGERLASPTGDQGGQDSFGWALTGRESPRRIAVLSARRILTG